MATDTIEEAWVNIGVRGMPEVEAAFRQVEEWAKKNSGGGSPVLPGPMGPPTRGSGGSPGEDVSPRVSAAQQFVENLIEIEKKRIDVIRELTEIERTYDGANESLARAIRKKIDQLKEEQDAYEFAGPSRAEQIIKQLVDAEANRLSLIKELTVAQERIAGVDAKVAQALGEKIDALKTEQGAYENLDKTMSDTEKLINSLVSAEGRRLAMIQEIEMHLKDALDPALAKRLKEELQGLKIEQEAYRPTEKKMGGLDQFRSFLQKTFGGIQDKFGKSSIIGKMAGGGGKLASSILGGVGSGMIGGGSLLGPIGAITVGLATLAAAIPLAIFSITKMAQMFTRYTDTINPGLTKRLELTMRDLDAVIGKALVPAVAIAIPIIRAFADAMLPIAKKTAGIFDGMIQKILPAGQAFAMFSAGVMRTLLPVIELLADTFATITPLVTGLLKGFSFIFDGIGLVFQSVVDLLKPVMVVIEAVATAIEGLLSAIGAIIGGALSIVGSLLSGIFNAIYVVIKPIIDVFVGIGKILHDFFDGIGALASGIAGIFSGVGDSVKGMLSIWDPLVSAIKDITDAFRRLINQALLSAAAIAKFFGMGGFAKGIKDYYGGKKESSTGLAAAQNPQIKSIEEVSKSIALSTFVAGMGGQVKTQDQINKELVAGLDDIDKNGRTLLDVVAGLPSEIASELAFLIGNTVSFGLLGAGKSATKFLSEPFGVGNRGTGKPKKGAYQMVEGDTDYGGGGGGSY